MIHCVTPGEKSLFCRPVGHVQYRYVRVFYLQDWCWVERHSDARYYVTQWEIWIHRGFCMSLWQEPRSYRLTIYSWYCTLYIYIQTEFCMHMTLDLFLLTKPLNENLLGTNTSVSCFGHSLQHACCLTLKQIQQQTSMNQGTRCSMTAHIRLYIVLCIWYVVWCAWKLPQSSKVIFSRM